MCKLLTLSMSVSSTPQHTESANRSPPTIPASAAGSAEGCPSTVHSARALAAADRRSQSLEGIVERSIRTLLAPSVTKEVQAVVCDDTVAAVPAYLSAYAQALIMRAVDKAWFKEWERPLARHKQESGLDLSATMQQERYAATVGPHEMPCDARCRSTARGWTSSCTHPWRMWTVERIWPG